MLSPNIVIIYDGTHTSIPTGFVREDNLNASFTKGWGTVGPNNTGGATTHTHTSPSHTHTMVNHTHTYTTNAYNNNGTEDSDNGSSGDREADEQHAHNGTSGGVSGGSLTGSATIGTSSNNPDYYAVIYIKASGYRPIPHGGIVYRNDTLEPTGFYFCDGTDGTPNLNGRFLAGKSAGGDAGSTYDQVHSHTYNHSHSAVNHNHGYAWSDQPWYGWQGGSDQSPGNAAYAGHRHSVGFGDTSTSSNSVSGSFSASDLMPLYKTLRANKNMSGVGKLPRKGDIAIWLGAEADVPIGWLACDGTSGTPNLKDYYIRVSSTPGSTGGSNSHSHTGVASHTHTATGSHSHGGGVGAPDSSRLSGVGGHSHAKADHNHSVPTVSSVTPSWNATTINANASNNEPVYRTVVYIQFDFMVGGSALFSLL